MRILTAGESHGMKLTAIIEGVPANLPITAEEINYELARRQVGFGRGNRMKIERDQVLFTSGVRHGKTTGSPLTMEVSNRDFKNWETIMASSEVSESEQKLRRLHYPRPGHADLVGGQKYRHLDLRNVLERSSARETTMRVAIGAIAKKILHELAIVVVSHVINFGGIKIKVPDQLTAQEIWDLSNANDVRIVNSEQIEAVHQLITETKKNGDTIGGVIEVIVDGIFAGLGSFVQFDRKLDGKLAGAVMSINAFKGVEFGLGFEDATRPGSKVMDEIIYQEGVGYSRKTNRLGGFEGGMTNGMPIILHGVMKPIPTLYQPLASVDIDTRKPYQASVERSDTTAVPAASVVAEAVVAYELAQAICEQFTSDSMEQLIEAVNLHKKYLAEY